MDNVILSSTEVIEEFGIDGIRIIQDKNLYRFTSDSVLLTKFASHKKGDVVADFCSGSGIVGLHYYALNPDTRSVTFFEIQKPLADLNEKSVRLNGFSDFMKVENCRIQDIDNSYNGTFSLILCNPPYKKMSSGEYSPDDSIAICRHEITVTQDEIISSAAKRLIHGGRFCICQRAERLTDLLCSLRQNKLEPCRIQFVSTGKKIYLCMVESTRIVKHDLVILPTLEN